MTQKLLTIIFALSLVGPIIAQEQWMQLPTPPQSLPLGRPRANYIVEHYWDFCPWKSAYSNPKRMEQQLCDFADLIPHAAADTVLKSVDCLIANTAKRPSDIETLVDIARATFHSDTAYFFSDQIYLPFVNAALRTKKLSPQARQLAQDELTLLNSSMEGAHIPSLQAIDPQGHNIALNDTAAGAETYVFIIEKPGDDRFERIVFAANIAVNQLIANGLIKPILIYAGTPDDDWRNDARRMPQGWQTLALPDAGKHFDLRQQPSVYIVDKDMTVSYKLLPLRALTINCENLAKQIGL